MFSGKYTTVSTVIEKIYMDYGIEVPKSIVMEYIWETIGVISRPEILIPTVREVVINNYVGILPVDLYTFIGCREKTTKKPLLPNTGYYFNPTQELNVNSNTSVESTYNKIESNGILIDDISNAFISINCDIQSFFNKNDDNAYKYAITNNTIKVGIKNTVLELAYLAFPVWEDGTPMVPEDPKILRGIVDYIIEKVAFKLMLTDRLSERKWAYINQRSTWSLASAINRIKLPTVDIIEGIKNNQVRLLPKERVWSNGFNNLNS